GRRPASHQDRTSCLLQTAHLTGVAVCARAVRERGDVSAPQQSSRPATASRLRAPQAPVSIAHRFAREISDRERERICWWPNEEWQALDPPGGIFHRETGGSPPPYGGFCKRLDYRLPVSYKRTR